MPAFLFCCLQPLTEECFVRFRCTKNVSAQTLLNLTLARSFLAACVMARAFGVCHCSFRGEVRSGSMLLFFVLLLAAEQNWNRIVSCFDPPRGHQPGWAAGTLPNFFAYRFQVWIEHSSVEFEHFALFCGMSKICSTCVSSAGIAAQVQGLGDKRPGPGNCVLVLSGGGRLWLLVTSTNTYLFFSRCS